MATRTLSTTSTLLGNSQAYFVTAVDLAASDDTTLIDVRNYSKARIVVVTTAFSSGNITVTPQFNLDGGASVVTFATPTAISATGVAALVSGQQDISTVNYLKFTRGGDANTGTVQVQIVLNN